MIDKPRTMFLWPVLLLFMILDAGAIIASVTWIWFPTFDPASPYRSVRLEANGGLTLRSHGPEGEDLGIRHISPASALGALPIGWWLVAGALLGLLWLVYRGVRARRGRSSRPFVRPRFTMFRGMVVIASISIWLWLTRLNLFWILCGSLVLLLALAADGRRSLLAHEIKTEGVSSKVWLRLGVAGCWIAVILASSWIGCVLFAESMYRNSHFSWR
jgi:hypothetical protein